MKTRTTALAAAALLAFAPVTATYAATTADPLTEVDEVGDGEQEAGDKGLWGLLGLLGLFAPLFNKRRDNDVHVSRTTTHTGRNDGNPLT